MCNARSDQTKFLISKNFKLHITVQEYVEVSFRLLQQCMVAIQKRRHGGYRKGSEKDN